MKYWAAQDMIREYDNIQLLSRPYLTAVSVGLFET